MAPRRLDLYGILTYNLKDQEEEETMPQVQTTRAARLEARITPELKNRLEYAASLRGATVTEFVVQSAREAAARTIREHEVLTLSAEASVAFAELLLTPPAANEAAKAAAKSYRSRYQTPEVLEPAEA